MLLIVLVALEIFGKDHGGIAGIGGNLIVFWIAEKEIMDKKTAREHVCRLHEGTQQNTQIFLTPLLGSRWLARNQCSHPRSMATHGTHLVDATEVKIRRRHLVHYHGRFPTPPNGFIVF